MGGARVLVNCLFCILVLSTASSSQHQSNYKDLLSSLYRKAVQRNKPLVVVLDNSKRSAEDRGETSGSHEAHRGVSSGEKHHDRDVSSSLELGRSKQRNDKLIAKLLLEELENRLSNSKITYNRQLPKHHAHQDSHREDYRAHDHSNRHSSQRNRHTNNMSKLQELLSKLTDLHNDRHDRVDDRKRDQYQKSHRDHVDNRGSYDHVLNLLGHSDSQRDSYRDQTRHGHKWSSDNLRSPAGKQISALRNGLVCAAKQNCIRSCYNNYRRQNRQALDECNDECEEKYDDCEERKDDDCNEDDDDCKDSDVEIGSTKGYPEEPEKYCKRC